MTTVSMTQAQRGQFEEAGYCIMPRLFDDAMLDSVQHEFERLWQQAIVKAEAGGDAKEVELARFRWFGGLVSHHSPVCAAFCRHPQLIRIAQQIVGPDVDLRWDQAIIKPPGKGKAFAWHQDAYYGMKGEYVSQDAKERYLCAKQVTFWVAITRTTIDNGTLWVAPEMHSQGLLPHVWSDEARDWQCQFDPSVRIAVEVERGHALLFTHKTPHRSGPNVSKEIRMAYQIGFGKAGVIQNESQVPVLRGGELVAPPE